MRKFLNKYGKVIIVYSIVYVSLFGIAVLALSARGVLVPDAIIYGILGFFGTEAGILGWIKVSEVKKGKTTNLEEVAG